MFTVLLIISGFLTLSSAVQQPQECTHGEIIPNMANCIGYFQCVWGSLVQMPDCPADMVFSRAIHVCVRENGPYDDCMATVGPEKPGSCPPVSGVGTCEESCYSDADCPGDEKCCSNGCGHVCTPPVSNNLTIAELCALYGGLIPHPTECQAYYNCSHTYPYIPRHFEQHLMECEYSDLFDAITLSCQPFENVVCGGRKEFKDACQYRRYKCGGAHCIPCSVRWPSCVGKPDGVNVDDQRLWTPYFIECYKERLQGGRKQCDKDQFGRTQIFHPECLTCVELEDVPREHGGLMPNCTGRADGLYEDDFNRCNRYTLCVNGNLAVAAICQDGHNFDGSTGQCLRADQICGQCGSKQNC